ncbi:hypothetical protein [Macrococcus capreoli]|uniref:hypothetical protein n=1 Tax=Macrococcus capreoli TaxID=2982690 RepID=UPI0021D61309|nr:hypothetical protein [Macrococcus sp. TMW 2.2395]MCU7556546.1 hypothetical protein [Macrococcus sp. TMW 2.2395]
MKQVYDVIIERINSGQSTEEIAEGVTTLHVGRRDGLRWLLSEVKTRNDLYTTLKNELSDDANEKPYHVNKDISCAIVDLIREDVAAKQRKDFD